MGRGFESVSHPHDESFDRKSPAASEPSKEPMTSALFSLNKSPNMKVSLLHLTEARLFSVSMRQSRSRMAGSSNPPAIRELKKYW